MFKEQAHEYRKVLRLKERENLRDTFYSEVLDLIAFYECGFDEILETKFQALGRKLSLWEVD